jgi:hypothetical protein
MILSIQIRKPKSGVGAITGESLAYDRKSTRWKRNAVVFGQESPAIPNKLSVCTVSVLPEKQLFSVRYSNLNRVL